MVGKYPAYELSRVVSLLCSLTFGIVLMAGLWPFYPPRNEAKWVENENAIRFGRYASLLSISDFSTNKSNDDGLGSIEVWLTPTVLHSSKTILAFESAEHPGDPFRLIQSDNDLVVQQHNVDEHGICRTAQLSLRDVFRPNERIFVAITLGRHQTNVYIRGVLALASPILGASTKNLTGRLVVGNSPNSNNSWSGDMSGLAIYHRQLTAFQVAEHYRSWATVQKPHISQDEAPVAVYLFNEHNGTVIHNQLDAGTDLLLPARFALLHPPFLDPVWRRFRFGWPGWGFWSDVLVNIGGFVPIGFLLLAYLSVLESVKRPAATTILLGFLLSLSIESLQWFLPTRDSDMTDLMNNTLGTIVGVSFYRSAGIQKVWLRFMNYSTNWL
jgi:hypothetical protein